DSDTIKRSLTLPLGRSQPGFVIFPGLILAVLEAGAKMKWLVPYGAQITQFARFIDALKRSHRRDVRSLCAIRFHFCFEFEGNIGTDLHGGPIHEKGLKLPILDLLSCRIG